MDARIDSLCSEYFSQQVGVRLDELLQAIPDAPPGGEDLRSSGFYREILEARREDDPTVPLGPWGHELKRGEWDRISRATAQALALRSKDLQVATWLLEAQLRRDGFAAIAPCVTLIALLCAGHWECLYPRPDGEDLEPRTNIIHWINEKLLPVVRLVPLTRAAREETAATWANWEQAKRNEQRRAAKGNGEVLEGMSVAEFATAMTGTPSEWLCEQHRHLTGALASLDRLTTVLNEQCGNDAPGLHQLRGLLEQIHTLIDTELRKRGVSADASVRQENAASSSEATQARGSASALAIRSAGGVQDRAALYAQLAQLAELLLQIEPHSPVPYLLRRAVSWGNLNTAELYQEMFLRCGGRLEVFELLGLSEPRVEEPAE